MTRHHLLILLFAFSPLAVRACDSVNLGMRSYHWDRERVEAAHYREEHPAIGCTNIVGRWDVLYFRNSRNRHTAFTGDEWRWFEWGHWVVGADWGLFWHGYSDRVPALPAVLPKVKWRTQSFTVNGYLLLTEGIALGLEIPLN